MHFMEPGSSFPLSQVPATCPYPEPARFSPWHHIPLPEDTLVTTVTTFFIQWADILVYLYPFLTKRASYFCFSSLCLDEQSVHAYPVLQHTSTPASCSTFNDADSNAGIHSMKHWMTVNNNLSEIMWKRYGLRRLLVNFHWRIPTKYLS
jgi:hypothetical protein